MSKVQNIPSRLHSVEQGNVVAGANEILDDTKGKKQNVVNHEVDAELLRLQNEKQDNLTFDNAPTEGSNNPVKSGGVYAADAALQQAIEAILLLIPSAASALNQLADKAFVNSSIGTSTATFRGTYNLVTDLSLAVDATNAQIEAKLAQVIATADNNDYCFVQVPTNAGTPTEISVTERYKFNGESWQYEYDLNNSGFTAQQWAAINSTITAALVAKLSNLPNANELQEALNGKQATLTFDNAPTQGSSNPVKSGGVFTAIGNEATARGNKDNELEQAIGVNAGAISGINEKIPAGATALNQMVDYNSMVAYVATIIQGLDATFNVTTADGHITLHITQTDGVITSVTMSTNDIGSAADIAQLQAAYAALSQSKPVPIAPSDTWPVANPQEGVIYRVIDRVNTPPQYYSDYMWNGTAMVEMAQYNNAIDAVPTAGSHNLVESGGVYPFAQDTESNKGKIQDITDAMPAGVEEIQITQLEGVRDRWNGTNTSQQDFVHADVQVSYGEKYKITAFKYSSDYPAVLFYKDNTILSYDNSPSSGAFTGLEETVPMGCNKMVVNGNSGTTFKVEKVVVVDVPSTESVNDTFGDVNDTIGIFNRGFSNKNVTLLSGALSKNNVVSSSGNRASVSVRYGDKCLVTGYKLGNDYPEYIFRKNGNIVSYVNTVAVSQRFVNVLVEIPLGVDEIVVNGLEGDNYGIAVFLGNVDSANTKVNDIDEKMDRTSRQMDAELVTGVLSKDNILNTGAGVHTVISVKAGYAYLVSGRTFSSDYPLYLLRAGNVLISRQEGYTANTVYNDVEVTIPEGVDTLVVNGNAEGEGAPSVKVLDIAGTKNSVSFLKKISPVIETGVMDRWNHVNTGAGVHASVSVKEGDRFIFSGYKFGSDYPVYLLRKNGALVDYYKKALQTVDYFCIDILIPEGVDELVLNSNSTLFELRKNVLVEARPYSKWVGKKIAWFGTSIPERSTYVPIIGYPEFVAKMLGAEVYNVAVGSSCARRGFRSAISENDPYGWTGMGQSALWAMGATVAEKNDLINNWETKWRSLTGYDVAMTDAIAAKAISCSYENKLMQFINDNPVDLYVFDHGRNDVGNGGTDMQPDTENPFNMSTYQGAMNTYIKLILQANPNAKILLISHYESQQFVGLIDMQKDLAEDWNLPFCNLTKSLNWAYGKKIDSTGYWSNHLWVPSGGESREYRLTELHMPDGTHPNTDWSGKACEDIGNVILSFIDSCLIPSGYVV